MSRALPAECNTPEWRKMMWDWTVRHAVEHQVRPVLLFARMQEMAWHMSGGYAGDTRTDADILHATYEWHDDFINACLIERDAQDYQSP